MTNDVPASKKLAGRTVQAFQPTPDGQTGTADVELWRHGPAVRAGEPAGDTSWEARITISGHPTIACRADTTWHALSAARGELETLGWRLAIAAARRDHNIVVPDRHRESTTVTELATTGRGETTGVFVDADPADIGTVAEQEQHRQAWIQARFGTTSSTSAGT